MSGSQLEWWGDLLAIEDWFVIIDRTVGRKDKQALWKEVVSPKWHEMITKFGDFAARSHNGAWVPAYNYLLAHSRFRIHGKNPWLALRTVIEQWKTVYGRSISEMRSKAAEISNVGSLYCASCAGLADYSGSLPYSRTVPGTNEESNTTWAQVGLRVASLYPDVFERQKEYILENAKKNATESALKKMEEKNYKPSEFVYRLMDLTQDGPWKNYAHLTNHILKKDVQDQRKQELNTRLYMEKTFGNDDFTGVHPIKIPAATLQPVEHQRVENFRKDLEWYNRVKAGHGVGRARKPRIDENSFSLNLRDFYPDARKSSKNPKYKESGRTNNDKGRERKGSITG